MHFKCQIERETKNKSKDDDQHLDKEMLAAEDNNLSWVGPFQWLITATISIHSEGAKLWAGQIYNHITGTSRAKQEGSFAPQLHHHRNKQHRPNVTGFTIYEPLFSDFEYHSSAAAAAASAFSRRILSCTPSTTSGL